MTVKRAATGNALGSDIVQNLPDGPELTPIELTEPHARIWALAKGYLTVRNNDSHTLYAYGLARALVACHPDADPEVVLPAILLHDVGWSQVPRDEILLGIAPGTNRPDLVLLHEREGARLAREILHQMGHNPSVIDEIAEIIDGHDTRKEALSLNDSLVKDADKLWRITPHGVDTVMDWFGLDRRQATQLIRSRVHDHLFTDTARTMAQAFAAIAGIDASPQLVELEAEQELRRDPGER
ncbi:HD domain-containing protein [Luteococcus sp. H138]|uniref:HD domain-containing protein n=1 Tax=unclassified Luteococcus TaxID=2639923 RepID=UPI00313AC8AF